MRRPSSADPGDRRWLGSIQALDLIGAVSAGHRPGLHLRAVGDSLLAKPRLGGLALRSALAGATSRLKRAVAASPRS